MGFIERAAALTLASSMVVTPVAAESPKFESNTSADTPFSEKTAAEMELKPLSDVIASHINTDSEPVFWKELQEKMSSSDWENYFQRTPIFSETNNVLTEGYIFSYFPKGFDEPPSVELVVKNEISEHLDYNPIHLLIWLGDDETIQSLEDGVIQNPEAIENDRLKELATTYFNEEELTFSDEWSENDFPPIVERSFQYHINNIPFAKIEEVAGYDMNRGTVVLILSSLYPLPEITNPQDPSVLHE